jgi:hypothetical protein
MEETKGAWGKKKYRTGRTIVDARQSKSEKEAKRQEARKWQVQRRPACGTTAGTMPETQDCRASGRGDVPTRGIEKKRDW